MTDTNDPTGIVAALTDDPEPTAADQAPERTAEPAPRYTIPADVRAFRLVREYHRGGQPPRTLKRRLTFAEAVAHCADPETATRTATGAKAARITAQYGPFRDCWELDLAKR